YKSYEISNFYENVIPQMDEVSPDIVIPATMEQLFVENNIQADRIVTAMPGQYISSRILSFQFSDPRKIEAAVFAEIEDAVPFNLDDMIIDHQILGQIGSQTFVLVAMTRKNYLGSFLEHLHRINIDPKLVDVDSLAFYNLAPYLDMDEDKSYGIVDVGHEKTSVCFIRNGVLRLFRSINLGGRYITEFLARDLETSFNEAQRVKHDVGALSAQYLDAPELGLKGIDHEVSLRIGEACSSIAKELSRTLYSYKNWEKEPIEKIFLSGGTSQIKNLDHYMSSALHTRVEMARLGHSKLEINPSLHDRSEVICQGVSIGVRAVTSLRLHSQVNLRKGEFAYVQDYASVFRTVGMVSRYIGVALGLMAISYALHYFAYSKQIESTQAIYKKELIQSAPSLKKKIQSGRLSFDVMNRDGKTVLNDRIRRMHQAYLSFTDVNSDSGALVSLERMSQKVPKDISVNVVEYGYETKRDGSGRVKIKVEADSFDTVAKFQNALKSVEEFVELKEKSADTKPGTELIVAIVEAEYLPR
ncbi:MAG: pilus assembly protein PilM, partial [Zetaproteobacteria bacterium]|nr:pilus assembly protein PilM [Zetaproteobacteria bacterium]